jgi:uncharacterized low-complexity protein
MKKLLIASVSSLALLMAGASYAAQHTAPKDDGKPQQTEMKKDTKKASKKKCPEGQMYSKKDKKCVPKAADAGATKPATAPAK